MADSNKRGFVCDDDCDSGEKGERGKRGKRGHRGHDGKDGRDGHDGRDGATGPTGPGSSGGGPVVTDPSPPTLAGDGTEESPLQVINVAPQPFTEPDENRVIFANENGNDEDGDGTEGNPYLTLQHAATKVPLFIPGGVIYTINYTGLGQESLPDGYCLPPWKAPLGFWYDESDPYFPVKAAVNLRADPKLVASLGANAIITEADLVPSDAGGGIFEVSGFSDIRNAGTGNGTTDEITDEGDGIAKLTISGEDFDGEATFITIGAPANAANIGTFPVVGTDGESIFYENPAVVPEANFAGTYESFIPFVFVQTNGPHGLWHVEFGVQNVTVAGIPGPIGIDANGDHVAIWRTPTTFVFQVDDPDVASLAPAAAGTVSVLFVQDSASGNVQIKTTKNFGSDDSLVGKLFISSFNEFWNAVIYHNTGGVPGGDTLYITQCFAPGAFGTPIGEFSIMEQSAELLTTCTFLRAGERRGDHRGGLTAANIDSMTLNGTKVTPITEGEIGLCQSGGTLITQGCHLTASRFSDAQGAAMSLQSYFNGGMFKGSAVDLERCYFENLDDPFNNGPVGWFYAYFGTVFHNVLFPFDTAVEINLFACKFRDQGAIAQIMSPGRNVFGNVSLENIDGFGFAVGAAVSRNQFFRVNGTVTPGSPMTVSLGGGACLVASDTAPFGDASFTGLGDFMVVDGLPDRTYEDFRQHMLLDLDPPTTNFDTVFEARAPGVPGSPGPYPTIQTIGGAGPGVSVVYNPVTGLVQINYESGVSTTTDAEAAVDAFAWPDDGGIRTKIAGSGGTLTAPGDDMGPTLLDVGVAGPSGEYTNIRHNPKTGLLDCPGSLGSQSTVLAYTLS